MGEALAYESAAGAAPARWRPAWVYVIAGLYSLLVLGLALVPIFLPLVSGEGFYVANAAIPTALVLCELGLLFVPVRVASRRPVTRRSLWIPLVASACLAALLALGGTLALAEYANLSDEAVGVLWAAPAAMWLAWAFVFWALSNRTSLDSVATKLHRWLLAGSVLELLVAVPTHLVVRRRTECCAGLLTAIGIGAGVIVMLLAFGPSVGFLYYRRWKQVRRP
jgi:hypothetical protein